MLKGLTVFSKVYIGVKLFLMQHFYLFYELFYAALAWMFQKYPVDLGVWKNATSEGIFLHLTIPDLLSTLRFYEQKTLNKGNFQGSEIWIVWKNRTKNSKVDRKRLSIKNVKAKEKKDKDETQGVIQRQVSTHGLI